MSSKSLDKPLRGSLTRPNALGYNARVRKSTVLILVGLLLLVVVFLPAQKKKSPKDLPPVYQKWLQEEVVYIITDKEKEVFLKLETEQDRDRFIEEFWKQRDPTPGTPRNEFKEEHYRRIEFVNKTFGRGTPIKGWRTDRGRIYIVLGMPVDVQKFQTGETYPMEIWLYQGNTRFIQAPFVRLLFFYDFPEGKQAGE